MRPDHVCTNIKKFLRLVRNITHKSYHLCSELEARTAQLFCRQEETQERMNAIFEHEFKNELQNIVVERQQRGCRAHCGTLRSWHLRKKMSGPKKKAHGHCFEV